MIRGKTTYKWYGKWVKDYHESDAAYLNGINPENYGKCHHVLKIPNDDKSYEIGVVQNTDGTFQLIYDHYGQSKLMGMCGGKTLPHLTKHYAKERAIKELVKKGFKLIKEENLSTGNLKITLQGPIKL